jgi:precorrin-2/cobalt-factor-2 C20-methyltransferase
MLVAGDHARNDMAGEEDSWKNQLEELGYEVTCLIRGLGECAPLREIFVSHCRQAMDQLEHCAGTLTGVGVGPGDPELMTLKAVRILQEADVVFVPDPAKSEKTAFQIAQQYLTGKTLRFVTTPMLRDRTLVEQAYTDCAQEICQLLDEGKQVAYITLGDPAIYSTYFYIHEKVAALGYPTQIVPGVPSFCAAAARLNISLCQGKEQLLIVPASHGNDDALSVQANKVFMKSGKSVLALQEALRKRGELEGASLVENCGLPGERILSHFGDLTEPSGYFSLVISKGERQ